MNNSPVKSELYVALEMVELTQFLPFTNFYKCVKSNEDKIRFVFLTGLTRYSQTSIFSAFTDYSPWQAKEVLT